MTDVKNIEKWARVPDSLINENYIKKIGLALYQLAMGLVEPITEQSTEENRTNTRISLSKLDLDHLELVRTKFRLTQNAAVICALQEITNNFNMYGVSINEKNEKNI